VCPLAPAPAALFVPWPWQAPLNWLGLSVALAIAVWSVVWSYRRGRGTEAGATRRPLLPMWLWVPQFCLALAGLAILLLVSGPSMDRNEAWYHSQFARYSSTAASQPCSLSDLFATNSANSHMVSLTFFLALGLQFLTLLLLVVRDVLTTRQRRASPQPSR
jgi:hypothetical protein